MSQFIDPVTGSQITVADSKDARFAHYKRVPGSEGVLDQGLLATTEREAQERAEAREADSSEAAPTHPWFEAPHRPFPPLDED